MNTSCTSLSCSCSYGSVCQQPAIAAAAAIAAVIVLRGTLRLTANHHSVDTCSGATVIAKCY
eukprot:20030-Heterococcus_DN1.PRE.1